MNPLIFDAVTIPVSLVTLAGILLFFKWWCPDDMVTGTNQLPIAADKSRETTTTAGTSPSFHPRAWAPFIAIVLSIPVALFILQLSHMSMINFIMLIGAVTAIALAPHLSLIHISEPTRR